MTNKGRRAGLADSTGGDLCRGRHTEAGPTGYNACLHVHGDCVVKQFNLLKPSGFFTYHKV